MARTLSDTLIVAVLEAATRLTGARGPIAGSAAANAAGGGGGAAATPPAGTTGDAPSGGATSTDAPAAPAGRNGAAGGAGGGAAGGGETDSRTAEQIAADFRTIYGQIEELVRGSAEQETKTVGFGRG
jgi:hypothetical protein